MTGPCTARRRLWSVQHDRLQSLVVEQVSHLALARQEVDRYEREQYQDERQLVGAPERPGCLRETLGYSGRAPDLVGDRRVLLGRDGRQREVGLLELVGQHDGDDRDADRAGDLLGDVQQRRAARYLVVGQGAQRGQCCAAIARVLGRAGSTICRELGGTVAGRKRQPPRDR